MMVAMVHLEAKILMAAVAAVVLVKQELLQGQLPILELEMVEMV
jgi:hypothetical protein